MTKKEKQAFLDGFSKNIQKAIEQMWVDALIYGHGFISMDSEGNINSRSAREAYELGKWIEDNCVKPDSN